MGAGCANREADGMTNTTGPAPGSIVVGVDGSPASDLALDWAARAAALEHRPLTITHAAHLSAAVGDGLASGMVGVDLTSVYQGMRQYGQTLLDAAATRARGQAPGIEVHLLLSTRDPRENLLTLAAHASLVVVGSRGRGTIASLLLGSVSVTVSKHAACPVVVVRSDATGDGRGGVLVEADGTEDSVAAIEFAYRTASIRALPVTVLRVFWDGVSPSPGDHQVAEDEPGLADERMLLSESVAGMREKFPDVHDRTILARGARGRPGAAADGIDLIVVSRPREGFLGASVTLGVTSTVVEHAPCNVAVVPSAVDPSR